MFAPWDPENPLGPGKFHVVVLVVSSVSIVYDVGVPINNLYIKKIYIIKKKMITAWLCSRFAISTVCVYLSSGRAGERCLRILVTPRPPSAIRGALRSSKHLVGRRVLG